MSCFAEAPLPVCYSPSLQLCQACWLCLQGWASPGAWLLVGRKAAGLHSPCGPAAEAACGFRPQQHSSEVSLAGPWGLQAGTGPQVYHDNVCEHTQACPAICESQAEGSLPFYNRGEARRRGSIRRTQVLKYQIAIPLCSFTDWKGQ